MPRRKTPLITGEYYHVFNRSLNKDPIFTYKSNSKRAIETLRYYRFTNTPLRLAYYLKSSTDRRQEIDESLKSIPLFVEIYAYTLMPNHFHLLLKQHMDGGVSKFLALFQNSITKYINTKGKKDGHVFKGQFKAVRIEDDNQFLHVQRYIHLNPYTSYVVSTLEDLYKYPFSSLPEFLENKTGICNKGVLKSFTGKFTYKNFLMNQADYQRKLGSIKHLLLE